MISVAWTQQKYAQPTADNVVDYITKLLWVDCDIIDWTPERNREVILLGLMGAADALTVYGAKSVHKIQTDRGELVEVEISSAS